MRWGERPDPGYVHLVPDRRQATVELEARYGRRAHEVLARLRSLRDEHGRIEPADVDAVAEAVGLPRAHVNGAAGFFADFRASGDGRRVRVCAGTACFAATGGRHLAEVGAIEGVSAEPVHCLGYCYASPAALDGEEPRTGPGLAGQLEGSVSPEDPEISYASAVEEPVVLARLLRGTPAPWTAWREVLESEDRARIEREVSVAGLRGRGGAGFPVARKWATAAQSEGHGIRYVVCNGDEGDPGSYVDRLLMERDPHGVLEGLALAGLAAGAERGFVYVRSEYPRARDALRAAVHEARAAGDLGERFDIEVFEGAGSYVAGEETSLIHSMEGLRGGAAARPPFPAEQGLYGRPTVINNVETLAAVPWIVQRGGAAYAALGTKANSGTKLVCLNSTFARPGVYEVEFGTSLRTICDDLGGGLRDGRRLRSLQIGGPLGGFLGPDDLDLPLAVEPLRAAGVELGHGSLVGLGDDISAGQLLAHVWRFAADESCGTCFPCRIGSRRGLEIAERIAAGEMSPEDGTALEAVMDAMHSGGLCGFGQGVPVSVRSLIRVYRAELGLGEPAA